MWIHAFLFALATVSRAVNHQEPPYNSSAIATADREAANGKTTIGVGDELFPDDTERRADYEYRQREGGQFGQGGGGGGGEKGGSGRGGGGEYHRRGGGGRGEYGHGGGRGRSEYGPGGGGGGVEYGPGGGGGGEEYGPGGGGGAEEYGPGGGGGREEHEREGGGKSEHGGGGGGGGSEYGRGGGGVGTGPGGGTGTGREEHGEKEEEEEEEEEEEKEEEKEGKEEKQGEFSAEEQAGLAKHNEFRRVHEVPPMKLDKKLCDAAKAYAKEIAQKGSLEHSQSSDRPGQGENLYYGCASDKSATIKEGVINWYNEVCSPGYTFSLRRKENRKAGHFTQVVWKESTSLGIGKAEVTEKGMKCGFIVGRYKKAGNMEGEYKTNVLKGHFDRQSYCSSRKNQGNDYYNL